MCLYSNSQRSTLHAAGYVHPHTGTLEFNTIGVDDRNTHSIASLRIIMSVEG